MEMTHRLNVAYVLESRKDACAGSVHPGQAQRFLSIHGQFYNLFRLGRQLLGAANYRLLRSRAFKNVE